MRGAGGGGPTRLPISVHPKGQGSYSVSQGFRKCVKVSITRAL